MRPGLGFAYLEEAGLALLWAAGVAPEGKDEKTAQRGRLGIYCRPAGKTKRMGILAKSHRIHVLVRQTEYVACPRGAFLRRKEHRRGRDSGGAQVL
jgi:hypothetical protein